MSARTRRRGNSFPAMTLTIVVMLVLGVLAAALVTSMLRGAQQQGRAARDAEMARDREVAAALFAERIVARMAVEQMAEKAAVPRAGASSPAELVDRGVGLMAQFEFARAAEAFAEAQQALDDAAAKGPGEVSPPGGPMSAREHDSFVIALNRAIAVLNQSEPGAQEKAIEQLQALAATGAAHPALPRVRYCLGLAHAYLGQPDQALPHFQSVAQSVPDDGAAAYQLAQSLEMVGQGDGALRNYERALALDPFLRSALLGVQRQHARAGREDAAAAALDAFMKLEENPRARLTEFKYTRMGPLSEALPLDGPRGGSGSEVGAGTMSSAPRTQPSVELSALPGVASLKAGTPIATDLDGDGIVDLFIAGGAADGKGSAVLRGAADGTFALDPAGPFTSLTGVRFACFADYDNDGRADALMATDTASVLQRQGTAGAAESVVEWPACNDALWADLDHDGDLDLVLAAVRGAPSVLMNRGDEGFQALGAGSGLASKLDGTLRVAAGDLDGDSQLDLILVGTQGIEVWLNDRFWQWRRDPSMEAIERSGARRVAIGEHGSDGRSMVALLAPAAAVDGSPRTTLTLLERVGTSASSEWVERQRGQCTNDADASEVTLLDPLGDGRVRPIILGDRSTEVFLHSEGESNSKQRVVSLPVERACSRSVVNVAPYAEPVMLEWGDTQRRIQPMSSLLPEGLGRGTFVAIDLRGRRDPSQSMRSNADGIGTRWASRAGGRWNGGWLLRFSSAPGQGRTPTLVGIGAARQIDALFIDWPDGVTQSELALGPDRLHAITETQRQISSCPVIFAWDGSRFAFETDALGVGGMGYLVGVTEVGSDRMEPVYAPPRPRESIRLRSALRARDGAFEIRLTEPMEEACYLDAARVVAWGVPAGWQMTLDERLAINGPEPTGAARFFRRAMAANDANLASLRELDGVAFEFGSPHPRFIGRLGAEGSLLLEFPEAIDAHPGEPALVIDGWVEYPYSQTTFAMWQEGALPKAPSIDALDPVSGEWVTLVEEIGYPAGMTREALLPLTGTGIGAIPPGCNTLRIRTSVELYIDRLRLAWLEAAPHAQRWEAPLMGAEVAECGFPWKLDLPQKRPFYDYERRAPLWDCRTQKGFYSRLGECTPLVREEDGALAIFGPGEEVRLRFDARAIERSRETITAEVPEQGAASMAFVLELVGWCKDMDRYTRDAATVAPLPEPAASDAASRSHRDALHRSFNTRIDGGR